jgi:hypothetical protein
MRRGLAIAIDVACVVGFVALGRHSHTETETLTGVAAVAAPFLAGTACGWAASWRGARPDGFRTGLIVWGATAAVGLALRAGLTTRPTPLAFVVVATGFLGIAFLGWRAVALFAARRRGRQPSGAASGS